ncbi:15055_t:CDS:1, partial [Funneliformis caledonium]
KITFNAIQSGSNKLKIHILQEGAAIFSELLPINVKGNDTLGSKSEIIKQLHRPKENLEHFFGYIIVVIGHSFKLFTIEELGCYLLNLGKYVISCLKFFRSPQCR